MADYTSILNRAAKLCSTGEKCSSEIENKLISWGMSESDAEKALDYLRKNDFINDERYARFYVRDKLKFNKWGRFRISYSLKKKGVGSEIVEAAMTEIKSEDYDAVLDQILLTKARSLGNIRSYENKAKLLRFAAQRGFLTDEIYKAIDRIDSN